MGVSRSSGSFDRNTAALLHCSTCIEQQHLSTAILFLHCNTAALVFNRSTFIWWQHCCTAALVLSTATLLHCSIFI
jgi:hypothetical protein